MAKIISKSTVSNSAPVAVAAPVVAAPAPAAELPTRAEVMGKAEKPVKVKNTRRQTILRCGAAAQRSLGKMRLILSKVASTEQVDNANASVENSILKLAHALDIICEPAVALDPIRKARSASVDTSITVGAKVALKKRMREEYIEAGISAESLDSLVADKLLPSGKWALRATAGDEAGRLVGWVKPNRITVVA